MASTEAEDVDRTMTDSPVQVDFARALQIIEMLEEKDGDETLFKFELKEANLASILDKVPKDMKVAVVSVVGNFRTGKSFLLTFMLRYLRNRHCEGTSWQTEDGATLAEGNANDSSAQGEGVGDNKEPQHSFEWRAGHERMTTGLWMYSEPFFHTAANGEKVAVLVVDTQGLFDNESSMLLTSCVFGLSTLMSSHQIYNVKERISEDHLQTLALFSEYGRMALGPQEEFEKEEASDTKKGSKQDEKEKGAEAEEGENDDAATAKAAASPPSKPTKVAGTGGALSGKAFQRLEFLVRDWPEIELLNEEFMDSYIRKTVMEEKGSRDLRETREQIVKCFENISCFMLPHPGLSVTRKTYDGAITGGKGLEPEFRDMLDRYMRRVFGVHLEPKRIHGRQLTAPELMTYIKTYVALFQDGRKFPEAKTVLQATAEANTRNAATLALKKYNEALDKEVGATVARFVAVDEATKLHVAASSASLELFDAMATMGPKGAIASVRAELQGQIEEAHTKYAAMNLGRDPMKSVRPYLAPVALAISCYLMSKVIATACGATVCNNAVDLLSHVYVACFTLLAIASAGNVSAFAAHMKAIAPMVMGQMVPPSAAK